MAIFQVNLAKLVPDGIVDFNIRLDTVLSTQYTGHFGDGGLEQ